VKNKTESQSVERLIQLLKVGDRDRHPQAIDTLAGHAKMREVENLCRQCRPHSLQHET